MCNKCKPKSQKEVDKEWEEGMVNVLHLYGKAIKKEVIEAIEDFGHTELNQYAVLEKLEEVFKTFTE